MLYSTGEFADMESARSRPEHTKLCDCALVTLLNLGFLTSVKLVNNIKLYGSCCSVVVHKGT